MLTLDLSLMLPCSPLSQDCLASEAYGFGVTPISNFAVLLPNTFLILPPVATITCTSTSYPYCRAAPENGRS